MRFIFIRHAQSENNAREVNDGVTVKGRVADPSLTPFGRAQATYAALYLKNALKTRSLIGNLKVKYLFASAMNRALSTALPISHALSLPIHVVKDLHEAGGLYVSKDPSEKISGMSVDDIKSKFPNTIISPEIGDSGWWRRSYETEPEIEERAHRLIKWMCSLAAFENSRLNADDTEEPCAVFIVHGMMNHVILNVLNNQDLSHKGVMNMYYPIANVGITQMHIKPHLEISNVPNLTKMITNSSYEHLREACADIGVEPPTKDACEGGDDNLRVAFAVITHNDISHVTNNLMKNLILQNVSGDEVFDWGKDVDVHPLTDVLYSGQGIGIFKI
eukprot:GDKJ01061278.1.p1 GENE.GDKJ01061278.1~~GDKJ01061278.1.p1  ORF type:complete len:332 (+),score=69.66 GDKJ01061278.1:16-1011(+)